METLQIWVFTLKIFLNIFFISETQFNLPVQTLVIALAKFFA